MVEKNHVWPQQKELPNNQALWLGARQTSGRFWHGTPPSGKVLMGAILRTNCIQYYCIVKRALEGSGPGLLSSPTGLCHAERSDSCR
jgi:hypothetical protein